MKFGSARRGLMLRPQGEWRMVGCAGNAPAGCEARRIYSPSRLFSGLTALLRQFKVQRFKVSRFPLSPRGCFPLIELFPGADESSA